MSAPVIITLPKYVSTTNSGAPVFKDFVDVKYEPSMKGRKRRLDHLSWEEKLQRKKLKNRVAAQTSRDKKKMKMEEMEYTIQDLVQKNEDLLSECQKLRDLNKKLSSENTTLRSQQSTTPTQCNCRVQNRPVDCTLSNGSAVSKSPLPQGQRVQLAAVLDRRQTTLAILKIVLTCLLTSSETSTQNWISTNLKSSLKAYSKISPQTWRFLLQKNRLHHVISNKITQEKWWGRHQSNWNPVEVTA